MQSVAVHSLKNVIMLSFHSSHAGPHCQNLGILCQCNSVRVHPYAYPQHMMVLKHFSYIQYGFGKQSVVVYSINNVIMPSIHSSHAGPNYKISAFFSSVIVHRCTYMPIRSIWWCSHTFSISIMDGCGIQSAMVYSLNNVIMSSFNCSHAGPN